MTASQDSRPRLAAIDWMRGLVMVIMAVDHAGWMFDGAQHLSAQSDSPFLYARLDPALPVDRFVTRLLTHLCAPTFVFLAGTGAALSEARDPHRPGFDRHLMIRGVLLIVMDLTLLSVFTSLYAPRFQFVLQVLFAIGIGLVLMTLLRRLPTPAMLVTGLALVAGSEWLTALFWQADTATPNPVAAVALTTGFYPAALALYPAIPWVSMMVLGWALGRFLARRGALPGRRTLLVWGVVACVVFVVLRAANGYGNMFLLRRDGSWIQWLHVSKYPPSLTFTALTLGAMALLLSLMLRVQPQTPSRRNPLLVFGRTPLFYYLVHFPLLGVLAMLTGWRGLGAAYLGTLIVVAALYPICMLYDRYKTSRRHAWTRYL